MKKSRSIIINHCDLKRIRNNFRKLLHECVSNQIIRLSEEIDFYQSSRRQEEIFQSLSEERSHLLEQLRMSIITCSICRSTTGDRYFNLITKEWVCTECLILLRETFYDFQFKKSVGDYDLEYLRSFIDL